MNSETTPEHLRRWPGLSEWRDGVVVDAPPEDAEVARNYPQVPDKGPIVSGVRLTLMTRRLRYTVGEPVRIIHVFEAVDAGRMVYIVGPKPVYGEYVNDDLQTPPPPDDSFEPNTYNGPTLPSPAVDYNFDITSYTFRVPGIYRIQWRVGPLESNILTVTVESGE